MKVEGRDMLYYILEEFVWHFCVFLNDDDDGASNFEKFIECLFKCLILKWQLWEKNHENTNQKWEATSSSSFFQKRFFDKLSEFRNLFKYFFIKNIKKQTYKRVKKVLRFIKNIYNLWQFQFWETAVHGLPSFVVCIAATGAQRKSKPLCCWNEYIWSNNVKQRDSEALLTFDYKN